MNDSGEFDSIAVAGRLTETLFPPDITKAIIDRAERTGPINLVVVPARELGTIPFVLLPIGPGREPLVQYASVTIAPSLRTLGLRVAPHATALRGGLAMGNPDLTRHKKLRLDALPGAESEAKRVGQVAGTRPILGKEATKQAFSSAVAKGPPLIFLATHGISNPQDPLDGSFVVLADGRLTAREIQKMRLMGRPLVVLSACQTGLGQAHEGGVIGLARGFHLAGAGSVVMSLWDVDDKATEALMTAFVEHLPNHCPARALRLAMQDLRKKGYPPSQWAGFTVFGDYCEFPPPSTR